MKKKRGRNKHPSRFYSKRFIFSIILIFILLFLLILSLVFLLSNKQIPRFNPNCNPNSPDYDVNSDRLLTRADYDLTVSCRNTPAATQCSKADVNCDNFIDNLDSSLISQALAIYISNLPYNFTPSVGYSRDSYGITLFNSSGSQFYSNDGISFQQRDRADLSGLPVTFNPIIGYFQNLSGGDSKGVVVLWDSLGNSYYINLAQNTWNNFSSPADKISAGLPGDFKPVAARYSKLGSRSITLWNISGETYRRDDLSSPWYNITGSIREQFPELPENRAPLFSYYANISEDHDTNYLWYNFNGELRVWEYNVSNNSIINITPQLTGLPSGLPTQGYFDTINERVIVWYLNKSYQSLNGFSFTEMKMLYNATSQCVPNPSSTCDEWTQCSNERQTRNCFNGCTNTIQTQECHCYDSDYNRGQYLRYYYFSNVSYRLGVTETWYNDTCLDPRNLTEWYCSNGLPRAVNYTCEESCSSGACTGEPDILCEETDDGRDYNSRSPINIFFNNQLVESHNDTCVSNKRLQEWYCNATVATSVYFNCEESCVNGTCTGSIITPPPEDCIDGQERCTDNNQYQLCANGQWLDPIDPPAGKCIIRPPPDECTTDSDCEEGEFCNSENSCEIKDSEGLGIGWIILIIFLIVVILAVAGVIIYIIIKNKNSNSKSKPSVSAPRAPPSPPSYPPAGNPQKYGNRVFEKV